MDSGHKLHSHSIAYGKAFMRADVYNRVCRILTFRLTNSAASGSGQQSVTGHSSAVDANSYWKIEASHGRGCHRSEPIPCGAAIRLRHVNTKCYLHSHYHNSPISGQQEVSCFDKEDHGDDWQVVCTGKSKEWMREDGIKLMHTETKKYLSTNPKYSFAAPIPGQLEVACSTKDASSALWAAQASILK
ncbi:hypothetical protein NQZ79_g1862 [Umbelopsis isabellina]|nr:hypothetical protein NQZ79_g1862 [Umbelopsis isabellina]